MSTYPTKEVRFALRSAKFGFAAWLLWLFLPSGSVVEKILGFAPLVIVPLGLAVANTPDRLGKSSRIFRMLVFAQPFAGLLAIVSLSLPNGTFAGLLALPWLVVTAAIGVSGFQRLLPRPRAKVEEACIDAAYLFLPIGGAWFLASRFGWEIFGFPVLIATLTAIHFHYAGFAAPIIAGMAGRKLASSTHNPLTYLVSSFCIVAGVPFVALGITLWQKGFFFPSFAATVFLTLGMWLLAWLICWRTVRFEKSVLSQSLLIIASVAAAVAMGLACVYSSGFLARREFLTIPIMVWTHGLLQAFGFATCGLIAFAVSHVSASAPPSGIPFSRLATREYVGPEFFSRVGLVVTKSPAPIGIVDHMEAFRREDFDPSRLPSAIRDFYEQTSEHRLLVRPHWQKGFRTIGVLLHAFGTAVGQMRFPLVMETHHDAITSRIIPLNDERDGRSSVRGWIRTYEATGQAMYVAAYSTHSYGGNTFMNIAFPLPGGNLTSVLHLDWLESRRGYGLLLTTRGSGSLSGDQGVYFANQLCPIRLPVNETIRVWSAEHAPDDLQSGFPVGATVFARHDMWILGFRFLALDYAIFPSK